VSQHLQGGLKEVEGDGRTCLQLGGRGAKSCISSTPTPEKRRDQVSSYMVATSASPRYILLPRCVNCGGRESGR